MTVAPQGVTGGATGPRPVERVGQLAALEGSERCLLLSCCSTPLVGDLSPAAMPGHNAGRAPKNEGMVYPADPPTVDEIVAVMRQTPADRHGLRLRALIVVLWRGGLRIQEALSLIESDLDARRGSILVRHGLCRIRHNCF